MKCSSNRGIGAELAIGLLLCGGAYFFFVAPVDAQARLARSRAEAMVAQGIGAEGQQSGRPTLAEFRRCAADVAIEARRMHDLGRDALDEVSVLSTVTDAAHRHELVLEQFQPNQTPVQRRAGATASTPDQPPPPDDRQAEYTFTVRGPYARLPEFIRALADRYPNSSIVHLRVSPVQEPGSGDVSAVITSRHWAFDAGPAIRLAESACSLTE